VLPRRELALTVRLGKGHDDISAIRKCAKCAKNETGELVLFVAFD